MIVLHLPYAFRSGNDTHQANVPRARALEEGHIPYDAVILRHPEIQADRVTLDQLRKYRLIILPVLECLSDSQIDLLIVRRRDLVKGGKIAIRIDELPICQCPLCGGEMN